MTMPAVVVVPGVAAGAEHGALGGLHASWLVAVPFLVRRARTFGAVLAKPHHS